MATTAELLINITANAGEANGVLRELQMQTRQLEQIMANTGSTVEKTAAKTEAAKSPFASLGNAFRNIGQIAVGMATGMAVADVTMGIAQRFSQAATQIDTYGMAVLRIQRITGGTPEQSSGLMALFERFAPDPDTAIARMSKLQRAFAGQEDALDLASAPGGKTSGAYLREFGVSSELAASQTTPFIEKLETLAEGFKHSTDEQQKNAAVIALMGKNSESMLKLLNQGRDGIEQVIAAAKKYGLILTGENLEDVQRFAFAHKDMDMALQGVALQLGAAFMPAVTSAAQATAHLAQEINQGLLPAMKGISDSPGTPVILAMASAAAVMTGSTKLLVAAASPVTAVINGIGTAAAGVGVGGLLAFAGAIGVVIGAFAIAGEFADKMSEIAKSRGAPDWAVAMIKQIAPPGAADLVDAAKQAKSDLDSLMGKSTGGETPIDLTEEGAAPAGVKEATATTDAAKAQLQVLQNAQAQRKAQFDIDSLADAQKLLELKSSEIEANSALVAYKRQIEDIDRNAVDFARDRLQLEEQRAVLIAEQSASPLKNQSEDITFQENLLKAQIKAAHTRGLVPGMPGDSATPSPAIDAMRTQLHNLQRQGTALEPGLLIAEHNVTLANRAKSATDLDAQLAANATAGQKLDIEEAMAPADANAVAAKRNLEDQQHIVDLEKQRFDLTEKGFAAEMAIAEAREKAASSDLFRVTNRDKLPAYGPAPVAGGAVTNSDESGGYPAGSVLTGPAVSVGDIHISSGGGLSLEDIYKAVSDRIWTAYVTAMQGTPVAGPMGGSFATGSAPR